MRVAKLVFGILVFGSVASAWEFNKKTTLLKNIPSCDFDKIYECGKNPKIPEDFDLPQDVDPLGTEIINWLRSGQGAYFLEKNLKKAIATNRAGFFEMMLKYPTKASKFHRVDIKSLHDFKDKDIALLMKKKQNTFVTNDRLIIVYYEKASKSWYLQVYDPAAVSKSLVMGEKVALSKCINSVNGDSGTVSSLFRGSFHVDASLYTPTDLRNPVNKKVLFSIGGRVKVGSTAKISGSVTCFIEPGNYAQPYMYPFFVQVPEGKRVKIKHDKIEGIAITGEWEMTRPFSKLAPVSPLVECEIGNSSQVCDTGAGNGLHIGELNSIFALLDKNGSSQNSR